MNDIFQSVNFINIFAKFCHGTNFILYPWYRLLVLYYHKMHCKVKAGQQDQA